MCRARSCVESKCDELRFEACDGDRNARRSLLQGWRATVRCAYGRSEGPRSQSSRECYCRKELDMETLVWTRGRAFPLSRLESRLRCPRCGSRYVVVLYEPPRRAAAR